MEERIRELEIMLARARLSTRALCFISANRWDYRDLGEDFDFVEFGRKIEHMDEHGLPPLAPRTKRPRVASPNFYFSRRRLTEDDVRDIRRRYAETNVLIRELAAEYGVTPGTIAHAIRGHTWKHLTDPPPMAFDKRAMPHRAGQAA